MSLLAHPLTRGLDLDDPATTHLRRQIIKNKKFLHFLYLEWYERIRTALPDVPGDVVELGSGAGFIKDVIPEVITTEVMDLRDIDVRLSPAGELPFPDASLRSIVMTNVLHHIGRSSVFFREATRAVSPGGAIIMIEPWVSPWSRFVYRFLHDEPFEPDAKEWDFPSKGPLSDANGALPWILFERDRRSFEEMYPEWSIEAAEPMMPFAYLVSGGVSLRALCPGGAYHFVRGFEKMLRSFGWKGAMFARIVVRKKWGKDEFRSI